MLASEFNDGCGWSGGQPTDGTSPQGKERKATGKSTVPFTRISTAVVVQEWTAPRFTLCSCVLYPEGSFRSW